MAGSLAQALLRPRGDRHWDVFLRVAGAAALVGVYPALRWPDVAGLLAFLCLTLFVSGPIAPFLPATYEPLLMIAGRVYPWVVVGLVGIAGVLVAEYVNYRLYRAALLHPRLERARSSLLVRKALALFERRPFLTVWLCSWSPLPYWVVRFLGPLSGYPVRKYLLATLLGRLPRLWFFAALGPLVPARTGSLAAVVIVMVALGLGAWAWRRRRDGAAPVVLAPQA